MTVEVKDELYRQLFQGFDNSSEPRIVRPRAVTSVAAEVVHKLEEANKGLSIWTILAIAMGAFAVLALGLFILFLYWKARGSPGFGKTKPKTSEVDVERAAEKFELSEVKNMACSGCAERIRKLKLNDQVDVEREKEKT